MQGIRVGGEGVGEATGAVACEPLCEPGVSPCPLLHLRVGTPLLAGWLRAHAAQLHPQARDTGRCLSRDVCHGLGNLDFVQNTPNLRNELEGFKSRK